MQNRAPCPKCGGLSWLEREGVTVIQRCLCGLCKPLMHTDGAITVMHTAVAAPDIVLPQKGTKTRACLSAVAREHPAPVSTGEVSETASLQGKETASLLVTLMARGLLERVLERRGLRGGSTWKLTLTAVALLKL